MSTEQQTEAPAEDDGGGVATGTDTLSVTDNRTGRSTIRSVAITGCSSIV